MQQPPAAVVRIIAPSGMALPTVPALIAVNDYYGLVVTNWHVVRDAAGQIWVAFPDGFRSPGRVMKIDRDWDLAALLIWKPKAAPLPVSTQAPQLGERLTIAGYGSGWFRAASGRCTEYFSPGGNLPAELVELSTPARQGDSGGPILNDRGEVAGVLFGADSSHTLGSYCGRLRRFLAPLGQEFERLPPPQNAVAQNQPTPPIDAMAAIATPPQHPVAESPKAERNAPLQMPASLPVARIADSRHQERGIGQTESTRQRPKIPAGDRASVAANTASPAPSVSIPANVPVSGRDDVFEQLKSFLAVIGGVAMLLQGLKILGKATG